MIWVVMASWYTIQKESNVIGTLLASGYTKKELIRHYMTLPIIVTLMSALIGNILGYTYFRVTMANLYYASYSLTTYQTVWSAGAFIQTTIVPVILMFIINLFILNRQLSLLHVLEHVLFFRIKPIIF